jgi:hypothetical protein
MPRCDPGRKEGTTLSTGAKVENSRMFAKHETALACAQRSAKKRRTQAIHATITNSRKHFLHEERTKIAGAFGLICVNNVSGRFRRRTASRRLVPARRCLATCCGIRRLRAWRRLWIPASS